ncbi:helix-turn-helix transcriptional regulator [Candidatus Saccharibacteria bacterium]|nr:helix-turn-helix transcriptional regulator [Candidatus Saccharibacteria bacterium]
MQFSKNLRELRTRQNITQEQLAEKIGVSRQMIARYESAENFPEMDKAITIAKVLNCTLDDLVNSKDLAQSDNLLGGKTISVKIEKSKMRTKDKVIYATLCCFASMFIFVSFAAGFSQITENVGEIAAGFLLPMMIASWFMIVIYFKSR